MDPFWAKDPSWAVPQALYPIMGWPSVPQGLVQATFIVPVANTHLCEDELLVTGGVSDGDLRWEWNFLVIVPVSLDRNANEELQLQQSPVWWLTALRGDRQPLSPSAVSLPQWVSHDSVCLLFPWFYQQISTGWRLKENFDECQLCFRGIHLTRSLWSILQFDHPKWKLNILSTRKTNLKIYFNSRAIFYLKT